jgi:predicted DNA-binding WGR domain protein
MKRYFEFVGADSSRASGQAEKFWEISLSKSEITVRFGKIGANGQTTLKSFPDSASAASEAEKLIAEKLKKGYVETGSGVKPAKTQTAAKSEPTSKTTECIACAEQILSTAKLCKHCGTLQNDQRFVTSDAGAVDPVSANNCLSCGNTVEPHQRVCGACDATNQAPKACPSCKVEIKSQKLKKGVTTAPAGRTRSCPSCGYYFFLPSGLADVIQTKTPSALASIDIEYLFFAAWDYQMENFGGSIPAIECDFDVAKPIYDNWLGNGGPDDFSPSWVEVYFPIVKQSELVVLLRRYESDPQLYGANFNIQDEDEVFDLEIYSYLSLSELDSPELRVALVKSLKMSTGNAEKSLISAVSKFLNSIDVFESF